MNKFTTKRKRKNYENNNVVFESKEQMISHLEVEARQKTPVAGLRDTYGFEAAQLIKKVYKKNETGIKVLKVIRLLFGKEARNDLDSQTRSKVKNFLLATGVFRQTGLQRIFLHLSENALKVMSQEEQQKPQKKQRANDNGQSTTKETKANNKLGNYNENKENEFAEKHQLEKGIGSKDCADNKTVVKATSEATLEYETTEEKELKEALRNFGKQSQQGIEQLRKLAHKDLSKATQKLASSCDSDQSSYSQTSKPQHYSPPHSSLSQEYWSPPSGMQIHAHQVPSMPQQWRPQQELQNPWSRPHNSQPTTIVSQPHYLSPMLNSTALQSNILPNSITQQPPLPYYTQPLQPPIQRQQSSRTPGFYLSSQNPNNPNSMLFFPPVADSTSQVKIAQTPLGGKPSFMGGK